MEESKIKPTHATVLAIGWMILIFTLSHQPGISPGSEPPSFFEVMPSLLTNLLHIPEYGILAALYWFSVRERFGSLIKINCTVVMMVFLFASTDEFHQSFILGRYASAIDIASDVLGALIAVLLLTSISRPKPALST